MSAILKKLRQERRKPKQSMGAKKKYSKEKLLQDLRELTAKLGRRVRVTDLGSKNNVAAEITYRRYFPNKGWGEILALAGVDKQESNEVLYTTDYLIERLAWLMNLINDDIGWAEVRVYKTIPNPQTYNRRFKGGLDEAKQLAKKRIE